MKLSLVVIKTPQLMLLKQFYEGLGLCFTEEQHGRGPVHYSTTIGDTVFEIYPLPASEQTADVSTRLGFGLDQLDEVMSRMKAQGTTIVAEPKQTAWGYSALVKDPDGRVIELNQL